MKDRLRVLPDISRILIAVILLSWAPALLAEQPAEGQNEERAAERDRRRENNADRISILEEEIEDIEWQQLQGVVNEILHKKWKNAV